MFYPCPQLRLYFHDGNGHPLVGGKLKTFVSNSTIPIRTTQTYRNAEGTILNPTEITLDERGECSVFLTAGVIYRFELYDADGALVFEQDGISVAAGGGSGESTTIVVDSGSDGIDVQQSVMDSGVVLYTISAKTIEDAVVAETERAEEAEGALAEDIADEAERATAAEKAAKTEVVAGNNIDVTKTTGANGQDVYTITGLVEATGVFGVYARNGDAWSRTKGDADITNLTAGNYHYTLFIGYSVTTPSNVIAEIESNAGTQTHKAQVDCSYAHDGWVEFSGDYYGTSLNPTLVFPTGVSLYPAAILFVHSTAGGSSGGGSGDNDKVAVNAGAVAGYLKDVLVSASDMVSLVPSGNKLMVNVNLDYSSDPKLATMTESQVDGATSNYGGYQLKSGVDKLQWGDDTFQTFDWLNAQVYQCMRLSDAQGTITKCNVALCGSLGFQNPPPCFNVGIFDSLTGECLGQSGLKYYGEDFNSDEEPCEVDMVETSEGSLTIKRNMRYIIQVWTCGLQLAGLDRSTDYNYTYDYTLRQNLQTTTSLPKFVDVAAAMNRASTIPMVSFGAESLF